MRAEKEISNLCSFQLMVVALFKKDETIPLECNLHFSEATLFVLDVASVVLVVGMRRAFCARPVFYLTHERYLFFEVGVTATAHVLSSSFELKGNETVGTDP
jgi:hypothetical protein